MAPQQPSEIAAVGATLARVLEWPPICVCCRASPPVGPKPSALADRLKAGRSTIMFWRMIECEA